MFKKSIAILLLITMIVILFPVVSLAADVQHNLPINSGMESTSDITNLTVGIKSLTQDRVSGKYAVQVKVGDVPNQTYAGYTLANSVSFAVYNYSQINLWVKPGAGAKWIKFFTGSNVLIKNDKNADGIFKVGEELVSGKWNEVTLDLTRTSNPSLTETSNLSVQTNESSTWTYDEIKSVYVPTASVDISQMVDGKTQLVNGELRFKQNDGGSYLTNTYNTTPTVLESQNPNVLSSFNRSSTAYNEDGIQVSSGTPRYKAGKFGNGVWMEEATTNLLTANQSSIETNTTGLIVAGTHAPKGTLTRITSDKWTGSACAQVVVSGFVAGDDINIATANSSGQEHQATAVSPNTQYSFSYYTKSPIGTSVTLRIIEWNSSGGVVRDNDNLIVLSGDGTWKRGTLTLTTQPTTAYVSIRGKLYGNGTYLFDGLQIEQKAYATSWTLGGSTRNADQLYYTLANALPSEFFACGFFKPDFSSSVFRGNGFYQSSLYFDANNRYGIQYVNNGVLNRQFRFNKLIGGTAVTLDSPSLTFAAGDTLFWAIANLTTAHGDLAAGMHLWVGVNSDAIQHFSNTDVQTIANVTKSYIGCYASAGYECNGIEDAIQVIDPNALLASGTTFNSTFVNNQYTATSTPTTGPGHLLLANFDGSLDAYRSSDSLNLPKGKISSIFIDSSYTTSSGPLSVLPNQKTYLSTIKSKVIAVSGDGNKVFYTNPNDYSKLYLLNLLTGENRKISDNSPSLIRTDYNGLKAAFKCIINGYDYLYLYDDVARTTTTLFSAYYSNYKIIEFEVQKNGTVYYFADTDTKRIYRRSPSDASSEVILTNNYLTHFTSAAEGKQLFFSTYENSTVGGKLYSLFSTPDGWKSKSLINDLGKYNSNAQAISKLLTNLDGSFVFYSIPSGIYSYQLSSKSQRKLDIEGTIQRVTENNDLITTDTYYKCNLYDLDTDTSRDIRPLDVNVFTSYDGDGNLIKDYTLYFDIDAKGDKVIYTSSSGLTGWFFNGVNRPERYLFSFDGKNSWQTYKDGLWTVVKIGAVPDTADFGQYGMTIDQVNAMTEADFEGLYADGRQVMHFDVAIYLSSVDPYITPSLKAIKVTLIGGEFGAGGELEELALYTSKQQSFNSSTWRKISKIYPVEIQPKEAEIYYFIMKDGLYKTYKNNQWVDVNSTILSNVETNWIDSTNGQGITQLGMTAEELRAIPESALTSLLPANNLSVIYAMKVQDLSTESYSSLITIDYVENLFDASLLTLKIKYVDGTFDEYPNLTKTQVEDFMEWVNERQYNRGPIFYCIKTVANGVEINDFINYYTIKSVSVNDTP